MRSRSGAALSRIHALPIRSTPLDKRPILADFVGKAPFAIKTTEGHHFLRMLARRRKGGTGGRPAMRSPLGIRDGRGVM